VNFFENRHKKLLKMHGIIDCKNKRIFAAKFTVKSGSTWSGLGSLSLFEICDFILGGAMNC
jgi:hypothetical protein